MLKEILAVIVYSLPIAGGFFTNRALNERGWKNWSSSLATGGVVTALSVAAVMVDLFLLRESSSMVSGVGQTLYMPENGGLPRSLNTGRGIGQPLYMPMDGGMPRSLSSGRSLGLLDVTRSAVRGQTVPASVTAVWHR